MAYVVFAPSGVHRLSPDAYAIPTEIELQPLRHEALAPRDLAAAFDDAAHRAPSRYALPAGEIDVQAASVMGKKLVQVTGDGTLIEFTLDPMLQRAAQNALEKYKVEYGALVAVRPSTGEVLALAEYARDRPNLRHLALQAEGPAASIFKVISSAALLEYGALRPDDTICVHGGKRKLRTANLRPDARRDRKCETFSQALGSSNNVAFARWADQLLTPAQLQQVSDRFLFNRRLPFLWGVAASQARIPAGSRLGFARSAAGFEGTTLSPLHAALIAATVGNNGKMMAPRLVARASRDGEELYRAEPSVIADVMPADRAKQLAKMMVSTTTTGTGKKFFEKRGKRRLPGVDVGGKTGSLASHDTGLTKHYSWFVANAPVGADGTSDIAVAALVVNGKEWTVKGIVPVRELLDTYFLSKQTGGR